MVLVVINIAIKLSIKVNKKKKTQCLILKKKY